MERAKPLPLLVGRVATNSSETLPGNADQGSPLLANAERLQARLGVSQVDLDAYPTTAP